VDWFPIAFTPSSALDPEDLAYAPSGTVSFDGTTLTWTSSYSYLTYRSAYMDSYCGGLYDDVDVGVGGYGYGAPEDGAIDEDGWGAFDTHASGFIGLDSLPCTLVGYRDYGYYGEAEDSDGAVDVDWGDEVPPEEEGSVPPDVDGDYDYWASEVIDVWSVDLSTGDSLFVSIDVLDSANTSSPSFVIVAPDSCPTAWGGGNIDCTASDDTWPSCPAAEFEAMEDGTYLVLVSASDCSTEDAPYQIGVDAASDPSLTLLADDVDLYVLESIEYSVTGTATITE